VQQHYVGEMGKSITFVYHNISDIVEIG